MLSNSEGLGSEIVNLFTQHSLDEDTGSDMLPLSKQLSMFSNHPTQPFHTSSCDLIQWIRSAQKDPFVFMQEHILKGLSLLTSLLLIADQTSDRKSDKSMFSDNSKWLQSVLLNQNNHSTTAAFMQSTLSCCLWTKSNRLVPAVERPRDRVEIGPPPWRMPIRKPSPPTLGNFKTFHPTWKRRKTMDVM